MFGKNLQHYRLKHGLTKKALAAQCGLSAVAISNYENGKR
ncbi:MAG: helix-turn-helix transcriptional regulator, partial [Proteobacteria bacterium]|nr:helix-turn-helix transcriptional regulator [Pseudomonadota bacterium]